MTKLTWMLGALLACCCADDASDNNRRAQVDGSAGTSTTGGSGGSAGHVSAAGSGGSGATSSNAGAAGSADAAGAGGATSSAGGSGGAADNAGNGGEAGSRWPPTKLSQTGLYSNISQKILAEGVEAFEPQFHLWSDSASKKRYVSLPSGTKIDTSNMDYWVFPVGTKLWKEFTRDNVLVETRLLQKLADDDWFMMAFVWNKEHTEAIAAPDGQANANGTLHDVPSSENCHNCHEGVRDKILGFSAIQLSHDKPGLTLAKLIAQKRLSAPPASVFKVPGTADQVRGLGYLHANCGGCHNSVSTVGLGMELWLSTAKLGSVKGTTTYTTTTGSNAEVASSGTPSESPRFRIVPGKPAESAVFWRLNQARDRNATGRMPPLATELADSDGSLAVKKLIESL